MRSLILACGALLAPLPIVADDVVIQEGRAALENGTVKSGKFTVERAKGGEVTVYLHDRSRKAKLRRVVLLVDGEGVARHPDPPTVAELPGFRTLAANEEEDAAKTAAALHRFATRLADQKGALHLALLREALLADPSHAPSLAALLDVPLPDRLAVYRALFEAHPESDEVADAVRSGLPADMPLYGRFDTAGWIDYLEAAARLGVTILLDPDDPAPEWKNEKRKLGAAIHTPLWDEESLVGYRSERLFVITSLSDPRLITAALQRGEGVCRALEEMFTGVETMRGTKYPLLVFLYSSEEEYDEKSKRVRGSAIPHNETGGMYVARDSTTRVFPPGGENAAARMLGVLAHELTHQWMHLCCPGVTAGEASAVATDSVAERPGYWVVEGLAAMVQDFVFDHAAGTYETVDPRSLRLDILANVGWQAVLPWEDVMRATATDFERWDEHGGIQVRSRLDPEYLYRVPQRRLFFAQVAGVCLYLQNHVADTRERLVKYLLAYYRDDVENLDVKRILGRPAAELGKEGRAYAIAIVPRPKR